MISGLTIWYWITNLCALPWGRLFLLLSSSFIACNSLGWVDAFWAFPYQFAMSIVSLFHASIQCILTISIHYYFSNSALCSLLNLPPNFTSHYFLMLTLINAAHMHMAIGHPVGLEQPTRGHIPNRKWLYLLAAFSGS